MPFGLPRHPAEPLQSVFWGCGVAGPISLRSALARHADVLAPVRRAALGALAAFASDPEQVRLAGWHAAHATAPVAEPGPSRTEPWAQNCIEGRSRDHGVNSGSREAQRNQSSRHPADGNPASQSSDTWTGGTWGAGSVIWLPSLGPPPLPRSACCCC